MNGKSLDILQNQLEKLKTCLTAVRQLFPETITEGKIDWEKLQATLGKENLEFLNERYVLNWAGKTDAFKVLQQSTTATLKPAPEESINFDTTENVFIEGENLEVLKVLQKAYYGKIKCIIIDPPYNTGSDSFIYPDKFSEKKEDYLKRIGDKDEEGYLLKEGMFRKNSKESGHYHSNWLSMMYPRLFLAKNLLREDGVIFVHIDDNEVHNLRLIMNEIFGEENFVANLIWEARSGKGGTIKYVSNQHEHILLFAKNFDQLVLKMNVVKKEGGNYEDDKGKYSREQLRQWGQGDRREDRPSMFYPIIHKGIEIFPIRNNGAEGRWRFGKAKVIKMQEEGELDFLQESGRWNVFRKIREGRESITATDSILRKVGTSAHGTIELKELFGGNKVFDTTKPIGLLKYLIELGIPEPDNDIILDFFGGSGTTSQAVLELNKEDGGNRKFILVQLPEKCDEESEAYKAGYKTIADIAKERIRRVINRLNHDSPDSKITMIKNLEQQKLFAEEKNQGNQVNHINQSSDNGFKVFKLSSSNFKIWRGGEITEENLETQLDAFTNPVRQGSEKENMLYELILKTGYLLTDKVEAREKYYSVNYGELIIALEDLPAGQAGMNQKLIDKIISVKPKKVITLDKLFSGNDQLKTNTVLQMRDAEIDFKTI